MGDFNINFLATFLLFFKLLSVVSSFNLSQVVTEPTRVSNSVSSLIDLIFVSSSVSVIKFSYTTIPPLANADHYRLHLSLSTQSCRSRSIKVNRKIWRYDLADFDRAMELLDSVEWDSILPDDVSVDAYWSTGKTCFLQIMEICIPNAILKLIKKECPMDESCNC